METKRLCPRILILIVLLLAFCQQTEPSGDGERGNIVIHLGMVKNSAAYIFTQSKMSDDLAIQYLAVEAKKNAALAQAWNRAKNIWKKYPVPKGLRKEHVIAVIAYTLPTNLYRTFNQAVRTCGANDSVYAEKFPFKSFHYLLSVAIQRMRENTGSAPGTTYRGMQNLSEGQKGSNMRFGYFASSSLNIQVAKKFGTKTLITIKSRYGVSIAKYSLYPHEQEVLIPPYEVFKITKLVRRYNAVDISLTSLGKRGIQVNVERGKNGTMRVVRRKAAAVPAAA